MAQSLARSLQLPTYIDCVCSKAKWQVGLLHRRFHNVGPSCIIMSLVWTTAPDTNVDKLESVQNSQLVLSPCMKWSDNYDSLLSHLNLLKLSTRRKKQKLLLCNCTFWTIIQYFHHFEHLFNVSTIPFYLHPPWSQHWISLTTLLDHHELSWSEEKILGRDDVTCTMWRRWPELYGKVNSNYFFTCNDTQSVLYYRRWCICSECSITRANKCIL